MTAFIDPHLLKLMKTAVFIEAVLLVTPTTETPSPQGAAAPFLAPFIAQHPDQFKTVHYISPFNVAIVTVATPLMHQLLKQPNLQAATATEAAPSLLD